MPASELSVDTLLDAINGIKAEVAALTSGLRSAQDRISRLEAATYTPPDSPIHAYGRADSIRSPLSDNSEVSEDEPLAPPPSRVTEGASSVTPTCSTETVCEVERHLKPINVGITAIANHLVRIERTIAESSMGNRSPAETLTQLVDSSTKVSVGDILKTSRSSNPTPHQEISSSSIEFQQFRTPKLPRTIQRPIFGQPSTPSPRRRLNVTVSASPFTDYVDERSPFSQLNNAVGEGFNWTRKSKPKSLRSIVDSGKTPGLLHQLYGGCNPYE